MIFERLEAIYINKKFHKRGFSLDDIKNKLFLLNNKRYPYTASEYKNFI